MYRYVYRKNIYIYILFLSQNDRFRKFPKSKYHAKLPLVQVLKGGGFRGGVYNQGSLILPSTH